jgi:hypothetical protein
MKLGFFMMPLHPLHREPSVTLQEDREAIILADQLGYHDAFVGEHYGRTDPDSPYRFYWRQLRIKLTIPKRHAGMDWVDPRLARRSMELMATEVMPRVNGAIGA